MKRAGECDKAQRQMQRLLLDEEVSAAERQALSAHLEACRDCGLEARVWEGLRFSPSTAGWAGEGTRRLVADTLRKERDQEQSSALRSPWGRRLAWAGAGVGALGLLIFLSVLVLGPSRKEGLTGRVSQESGEATIALLSGEAYRAGGSVSVGEVFEQGAVLKVGGGRAGLVWKDGSRVILDRSARLKLLQTRGNTRRLRLRQGRLLAMVAKRGHRQRFSVETPFGQVVVKGTRFWVDLSGAHKQVGVLQGRVRVRTARSVTDLVAGQVIDLIGGRVSQITGAQRAAMSRLARTATIFGQSAGALLLLSTEPTGAQVSIDGEVLGNTPLGALVSPGRRWLEISRPGYKSIAQHWHCVPYAVIPGFWRLKPVPRTLVHPPGAPPETLGVPMRAKVSPRGRVPSITALLREVRTRRLRKDWRGVARTYRRLIRFYPGSREARTCLVPLGEMQLTYLNQARAALRSFDNYLRGTSRGALAREAFWGRIRALRRLGRKSEEIASLRRFLRTYPRSLRATSARTRLERLVGSSKSK